MIIECKKCGRPISDQAYRCPHCNAVQNKDVSKKRIFWIILICLGAVAIGALLLVIKNKNCNPSMDANMNNKVDAMADIEEEEEEEDVLPEEIIENAQNLFDINKRGGKVRYLLLSNKAYITPIYAVINIVGSRKREMNFVFEINGSWNATEYFDMGYHDGTYVTSSYYPNGQIKSLNIAEYGDHHDSDAIDFLWDGKNLTEIRYDDRYKDMLIHASYDGDKIKSVSSLTYGSERLDEYKIDYDLIEETTDEYGNWTKRTWSVSNNDEQIVEERTIIYW